MRQNDGLAGGSRPAPSPRARRVGLSCLSRPSSPRCLPLPFYVVSTAFHVPFRVFPLPFAAFRCCSMWFPLPFMCLSVCFRCLSCAFHVPFSCGFHCLSLHFLVSPLPFMCLSSCASHCLLRGCVGAGAGAARLRLQGRGCTAIRMRMCDAASDVDPRHVAPVRRPITGQSLSSQLCGGAPSPSARLPLCCASPPPPAGVSIGTEREGVSRMTELWPTAQVPRQPRAGVHRPAAGPAASQISRSYHIHPHLNSLTQHV